jgi:CelD/BcsL family acetyltransferase involved in cellulose biosynthesis
MSTTSVHTEPTSTTTTGPHTVITRIISDAGFDALKPVWDSLVAKSDINTIFLTHAWLRSWWAAFGNGHELCILAIKKGDEIIGLAPLMIRNTSLPWLRMRTVQFIGTPDADYGDIIGADKQMLWPLILDYLMTNKNSWNKISFEQINQDSASLALLTRLLPSTDELFQIVESDVCLKFFFTGNAAERNAFSIRRSHDLKRCQNYFKGAGGFEIRRFTSPNDIERELRRMFLLHCIRWESTSTPSKFHNEQFRVFYYELVNRLQSAGEICLMGSYCGDQPIALSFNFEYNQVIYHYTLAYNQFYAKKSPGTLHVLVQTETFIKDGFNLDFARGAGPYKKLVADEEYRNYRITVYGRSWEKQVRDAYDWIKRTSFGQSLIKNRKAQEWKTRALHAIHERGFLGAFGHGVGLLLQNLLWVTTVNSYSLTASDKKQTNEGDASVKELSANDSALLATYYGYLLDSSEAKVLESRFQNGEQCIAVFEYDIISGLVWLSSGADPVVSDLRISPICESPRPIGLLIHSALQLSNIGSKSIRMRNSALSSDLKQEFAAHGITISKHTSFSLFAFGRRIL